MLSSGRCTDQVPTAGDEEGESDVRLCVCVCVGGGGGGLE